MIIEDTIPVNLGTEENPQITYIAASLSDQEKKDMTAFLHKHKINFA
jgi:hypothetical protein